MFIRMWWLCLPWRDLLLLQHSNSAGLSRVIPEFLTTVMVMPEFLPRKMLVCGTWSHQLSQQAWGSCLSDQALSTPLGQLQAGRYFHFLAYQCLAALSQTGVVDNFIPKWMSQILIAVLTFIAMSELISFWKVFLGRIRYRHHKLFATFCFSYSSGLKHASVIFLRSRQ